MAYEPTEWKSGDVITSTKLNKLENGVAEISGGGTGGGVLVCNVDMGTGTLDKTWNDIFTALKNGVPCFWGYCDEVGEQALMCPVLQAYNGDGPSGEKYYVVIQLVTLIDMDVTIGFGYTSSPDGYPVLQG